MRAVGDLQAVEHHHRQAHVIEPAGHQLAQRGAGPLDEQLRDRALGGRARLLLDFLADRLADDRVLPGRDAGKHPVHHRPRQRIPIGEVLVALHRQLVLIVGRAHPRATDRHPPTAECHRSVLVTVTLRCPVRVMLAPRAHDLIDLPFHQLMHDRQAETDAQCEQPLPRCSDELAERLLNLRRERTLKRISGRDDLRSGYLLHGGPPVLSDLV